jgi:drug/metabolite transporter (DMT)-like permease
MNVGKCLFAGGLLTLTFVVLEGWDFEAPARAYGWLVASAIAGLTIGDTAYFGALVRLGVPRAMLLLSTAPVFAAIGGSVWLGEDVGLKGALGIAITLAGIGAVVWTPADTLKDGSFTTIHRAGLLLGLLSGVGQAAGSVMSKRAMLDGIDPLATGGLRLLAAGVALVAIAVATRRAVPIFVELGKQRTWLRVIGAGFVGSYVGIWLAQAGLRLTPSVGVASTLLATSPVFALPLAHLVGHERMRWRSVIGSLIAVVGIAVLTW